MMLKQNLEVAYPSIPISMGTLEPGFVGMAIATPRVSVDVSVAVSVDGCASAL